MTSRPTGANPVPRRSARAAGAAFLLAATLACAPRPAEPVSPPAPIDAAREVAPEAPPFSLRRPVCIPRGLGEIALLGEGARAAGDVVVARRGGTARPRLVVVKDADVAEAEDSICERLADGAVLFVDDWNEEPEHLLRLVHGGKLRNLGPDDPPLAGPRRLRTVPTAHAAAHNAGNTRIVGVEADGRLRLVATVQDTLCHGCSCDALPGRRAFAENLVAFAATAAASLPPPAPPPVAVRRATLVGDRLHVGADGVAPSSAAATLRLEVTSLSGCVLAEARAGLAAGTSRPLDLDIALAAPFEVLDHRVVATLTTDDSCQRDVRPLVDLVGASDLRVVGSDTLWAGGPGTVRLIVRNSLRGEPIVGARLSLCLADEGGGVLARTQGVSDQGGSASLVLQVPADAPGKCRLLAESVSALTTDQTRISVAVASRLAAQVLCDLPIHRPGDGAGVRALVVEQPSGRPAVARKLRFELLRDREVVGERASAETDGFGVATATLRIPGTLPPSDCRVSVVEGSATIASAPLRVERFETPTFQVTLSPSSPQWTIGRDLPVTVACARFDGRPIAGAAVTVELRPAWAGALPLSRWEGRTDAQGAAILSVEMPKSKARAREAGADLLLLAVVRDEGGREVRTHARVARAVESAGEGEFAVLVPDGPLAPGRPGRVLLQTRRERGSVVDVSIGKRPALAHRVDEFGLVEVVFDDVAPGETISVAGERRDLPVASEPLCLTVGRRVALAGGCVAFRVVTTEPAGFAYVDMLRDGAVVATQTVPISAHAGVGEVRLPDGVAGPVVLHAYVVGRGDMDQPPLLDDARALLIVPREEIRATVTPSHDELAPGESLDLAVHVADAAGRGTPSILAVRVADEAVLSLVAAEPESARIVLVLDDAVRRATGRIGGLSASGVATMAARRALTEPEQRVADALFAALDDAVRYPVDTVTLPARVAAYPKRVGERLHSYCRELISTLRAVLTGPLAPPPDDTTNDIVKALRVAETRGAFGREGLVDPWGSPLGLEVEDGRIRTASIGPDGERGTPDDVDDWIDADATRKLHEEWCAGRGAAFDAAGFATAYLSRRAGAGGRGGGGMGQAGGGGAGGSGRPVAVREPARMRRFFPSALYWSPALLTDADGRSVISLRAPDSLTTWRVDVVASDRDGRAADASTEFVTSLPFVIEADPPPAMLVGDEVEVPAILRWSRRMAGTASVAAEVSREGRLLSSAAFDVPLGDAGERASGVRIRATSPGALTIRLRAHADEQTDAVERVIGVVAAGREIVRSAPLRLAGGAALRASVGRPDGSIAGSDRAEVRIAASPIAAVLDGVEGLLQKPHGCFEQTSSTLYPDVLALLYLRRAGRSSPEMETRFREAIDDGIGRLLKFEIAGGGFDWFGSPPAKPLLSAYGLHEWVDISSIRPSSRAVAERTAAWLISLQREDGSFPLDHAPYHWREQAKGTLAATAYVAWALARCDADSAVVRRAAAWLRPRLAAETDPYALALCIAALAEIDPADPAALTVAGRLASLGRVADGALRFDAVHGTALHGCRDAASVEATAIAALAALRLGRPDVLPAEPLLRALARDRQADGTWGTTQATVLALRAQLAADPASAASATTLTLRCGGRDRVVEIRPDERDLIKVVDLTDLLAAKSPLVIDASCTGGDLDATLCLHSAVPFDVPESAASPLRLTVTPDRKTCAAGALVTLSLHLATTDPAPAAMPLLQVPLGAGFVADGPSLDALRRVAGVERVESDSQSVVIYLRELQSLLPFEATIGVRPRLRGRITAPPASACPYYEPDARVHAAPATFTVE